MFKYSMFCILCMHVPFELMCTQAQFSLPLFFTSTLLICEIEPSSWPERFNCMSGLLQLSNTERVHCHVLSAAVSHLSYCQIYCPIPKFSQKISLASCYSFCSILMSILVLWIPVKHLNNLHISQMLMRIVDQSLSVASMKWIKDST